CLFERNKRNVRLTPDGEKLRSYASQLISLSDNLISQFKEPDVEGNINFGSPEDFATYYMPDILSDFVHSHPKVVLNVNCDLTLTLIKDFEKKKYDLIIIKQEPGNIYHGAKPLWREQLVWASSDPKDLSRTFKKSVNAYCKDSGYLPLVLSPPPCVYRQRAIETLDRIGVPWKVTYTSQSFAGSIAAVKAGLGLGLTVLPRNMLPETLIPLELQRGWPRLKDAEICLLTKSKITPAAQTMIEFIRNRISFNQAY
ncbi:MAG: LysR family transcriptional regulator, partial [Candidatus Dadabacteria bacterium]|nr:LysR family transcriptional regulator [Candidatus Dadabacteria bacterium]